jgi:hypothetical protein
MKLNLTKDGETVVVEDVCSYFDPHNFPKCVFWLIVSHGDDLINVYGLDLDPYEEFDDKSFEDCKNLKEIHAKLKDWPYTEKFYAVASTILRHLDGKDWKICSPSDVTEKDSAEMDEMDDGDDFDFKPLPGEETDED